MSEPAKEYREPPKQVCPACGCVHWSIFRYCPGCQDAMNRGQG